METTKLETDVCVAGGGPAGLVAALLLLKAGHRVTVLERHASFDREYRGEVLMPRFIQMFRALNLLEYVESQKHLKLRGLEIFFRSWRIGKLKIGDAVPEAPYALWMPQPILLAALNEKAKTFPGYSIHFGAPVTELLSENGRVTGTVSETKDKRLEVRAKVTLGADGRSSAVSRLGAFAHEYDQHDFDILWFSVKRPENEEGTLHAFFGPGRNYLTLPKYPDLLQCGLVMKPGEYQKILHEGVDRLRGELLKAHPVLHPFAENLKDFEPFVLLQCRVHLVKEWAKDGCLLIGDSAHTCSPAGAVGVSVACETAIVAAEVVSKALKSGNFSKEVLGEVQIRREKDIRDIHVIQRRFGRGIAASNPVLADLAAIFIFFAAKTRIFPKLFRRMAALPREIKVPDVFRF